MNNVTYCNNFLTKILSNVTNNQNFEIYNLIYTLYI